MIEHGVQFIPQELKTSIVEIYRYENQNFEGTLQNGYYPKKKGFKNLTQLLFLMEGLQDQLQFPQKCMEPRSFNPRRMERMDFPEVETTEGAPLATFKISIYFRQNASWQGNVVWVEKGTEAQFRSALELTFLLDSVLV